MIEIGSLAGPVLGGFLVTAAGSAIAFAVDAATFAISAGSLVLIRSHRRKAPGADADGPADVAEPVRTAHAATEPANLAQPGAKTAGQTPSGPATDQASLWSLLRQSRLLQIIVLVCIAANLTSGGTFEVALPALAHASFGAAGSGALIACFGGGAVAGTLAASRSGTLHRPAFVACGLYLVEATAIGLVPYLGGLVAASVAILVAGVCNGFGNIVIITLLQKWAPSQLLGRVMSLVMLAGIGSFPASVAVAGVLVRHLGPNPFFPVAGAVLAVAIVAGLTQSELRDFGRAAQPPSDQPATAAR